MEVCSNVFSSHFLSLFLCFSSPLQEKETHDKINYSLHSPRPVEKERENERKVNIINNKKNKFIHGNFCTSFSLNHYYRHHRHDLLRTYVHNSHHYYFLVLSSPSQFIISILSLFFNSSIYSHKKSTYSFLYIHWIVQYILLLNV